MILMEKGVYRVQSAFSSKDLATVGCLKNIDYGEGPYTGSGRAFKFG